jgi:rhodanese-related sulfurtransferase
MKPGSIAWPGRLWRATAAAALLLCVAVPGEAAGKPASSIPAASLVQPAQLASQLQDKSSAKPLLLQVGFRTLYDQAHIPGSEYAGPTSSDAGLQALRDRVARLPKDAAIVIYCGCCPWSRCPNVAAAFDALGALGFGNVKVLYIADNFGADWVDKGYPVEPSK